jgi:hypothetical protein
MFAVGQKVRCIVDYPDAPSWWWPFEPWGPPPVKGGIYIICPSDYNEGIADEDEDCFQLLGFPEWQIFHKEHFEPLPYALPSVDNVVCIRPLDIVMRQLPKLSAEWRLGHGGDR